MECFFSAFKIFSTHCFIYDYFGCYNKFIVHKLRRNSGEKVRYNFRFYQGYKSLKIYVDSKGYRRFKDSDKLLHRWVAEKKLGRKLKKREVEHHENRDKLDNDPSNLWVFKNQAEHYRIHEEDGDFDG
mgnify:CR=1 FL=1